MNLGTFIQNNLITDHTLVFHSFKFFFFCLLFPLPGTSHPFHTTYPSNPTMSLSNLGHMQQFPMPIMTSSAQLPYLYPPNPGSPKTVHPSRSHVHSNPSHLTSASSGPHVSDSISATADGNPMTTHMPTIWAPQTPPLFSLANMLSMAMSMAQSFIPPPNLPASMLPPLPSLPGFPPHFSHAMPPQPGYPMAYAPHYTLPVQADGIYPPYNPDAPNLNQDAVYGFAQRTHSTFTHAPGMPTHTDTHVQQMSSSVPQKGFQGSLPTHIQHHPTNYSLPQGYTEAFPRPSLSQASLSRSSSSGLSSSPRPSPESMVSPADCESAVGERITARIIVAHSCLHVAFLLQFSVRE